MRLATTRCDSFCGVSPQDWVERQAAGVAAEVRRLRKVQRRSAQWVADRTVELGYPISRATIADLENGRRKWVTIAELITLAAALNTVPLALLLPSTPDEKIEILPDNEMPVGNAIGWFAGTTNATPDGVERDPSATSRLELTMRLNEVNEHLEIQQHNLRQTEAALQTFTMRDELREHQQERVEHTRQLVESLEGQRDSIRHILAQGGDHDGG